MRSDAPQTEDLMTVADAAAVLCVHYQTVISWVRKGVFRRIVRVGPCGSIRLYRDDVYAQRVEIAS